MVHPPKSEPLRNMFYRSEILQVMYWLRGEGFGEELQPADLERFLGVDPSIAGKYLELLVTDGFVERRGARYALSEVGIKEAGLEFASSFADLTRPTHGECSADCWCHNDPDEAAACAEARAGGHAEHEHAH